MRSSSAILNSGGFARCQCGVGGLTARCDVGFTRFLLSNCLGALTCKVFGLSLVALAFRFILFISHCCQACSLASHTCLAALLWL